MKANKSNQTETEVGENSVQEVSKQKFGKTDARYWAARVFKNTFTKDGRSHVAANYSVKIAFQRQRATFALNTANKEAAASKALDIFRSIIGRGWEATLAELKPTFEKPKAVGTVGEWIEAVRATTDFRSSTLQTYTQCLRLIVSEIADIGDQPALDGNGIPKRDRKRRPVFLSRFDYRAGGRDAWIAKVDAQSLDILTPEAVQRWRMAYVARAGESPEARRRAENSATANIRNARSLFSPKAREFASASITLPDPLPFAGAKLEKRGSTRYVSKIDAPTLIAQAREELSGEPFKIFCLGLFCGLRKKEIDALLWDQVDFPNARIRIEPTKYFHPKSEDSIGAVDLDPQLLALVRGWKSNATGEFVIESTRPPRYENSRANYRAEKDFETVYRWLRSKGIDARKPLHELRKELGAILASKEGIFAAQNVLRHAQISTTAAHYADKKQRITAGLGALLDLDPSPNSIPFAGNSCGQTEIETPGAGAKNA